MDKEEWDGREKILGKIIDQIIQLQKLNPDYVTERSREFIQKLLQNGLAFCVTNNGDMVATCYQQPLKEEVGFCAPDQIYRLGGLSVDKNRANGKSLLALMNLVMNKVKRNYEAIIMKSDNQSLGRWFSKNGAAEVDFFECREKFPEFLELYLKNAKKPEDYYHHQMFYVYDGPSYKNSSQITPGLSLAF
jgi:hypothetical protein